jgi:serine/threonine-protein kinase
MATVCKGVNEILGQEVAVKVLDPLLARNTELRDRFIQEARIQVALRHPGIVSVLNAHVEESLCCIIQELIDGKSLDSVLAVAPQVPN